MRLRSWLFDLKCCVCVCRIILHLMLDTLTISFLCSHFTHTNYITQSLTYTCISNELQEQWLQHKCICESNLLRSKVSLQTISGISKKIIIITTNSSSTISNNLLEVSVSMCLHLCVCVCCMSLNACLLFLWPLQDRAIKFARSLFLSVYCYYFDLFLAFSLFVNDRWNTFC